MLDKGIEALREQKALFALIDPVVEDPIASAQAFDRLVDLERRRLPTTALPKDKRPYLVDLGCFDRSERQIASLLRRALEEALGEHDRESVQPRSVCAFISAPGVDLTRLASQMARACVLVAHTRRRVLFRYWDPRIASQLPRLLGDDFWGGQLRRLQIDAWWCYDGAKSPPELAVSTASSAEPLAGDASGGPTHLTEAQFGKLAVLSWANRIAGLAPGWELDETPALRALEDISARALNHGLTDEADILRFALAALSIHPEFDRHPHVARTMAETREFARTMQGWSPEFIDQLKRGEWKPSDAGQGQ